MAKIALINASAPAYNLAIDRMKTKFTREGHEVFISSRADAWARQCDEAYISVIFTWHLPGVVQDIRDLHAAGVPVEIGGPAATAIPGYFASIKGVRPHAGLDERFEHIIGNDFRATFTSRGCPRGCEFCIVSEVEGRRMIEYKDFPIPVGKNPYVCDNNLLATSWAHQKLVVKKLKGVRNLDLNSGFDDRIFIKNPEKYWNLYRDLDIEAWRFAYDQAEQREPIKACAEFLHGKGINYRNIIVFCLVGFPGESFEASREKLQYLVDIEVSPYPMIYRPLNTTEHNTVPPGWNPQDTARLFSFYGVPKIWRRTRWEDFSEAARRRSKMAPEQESFKEEMR